MSPIFFLLLGFHLVAVLLTYGPALVLPYVKNPPAWMGGLLRKVSVPASLSIPISGAAMLVVAGINPATKFWLWFSILLYVGTLAYLVVRQRPRILRLLRGDSSGELLAAGRRASVAIAVLILSIGALMMLKPTF